MWRKHLYDPTSFCPKSLSSTENIASNTISTVHMVSVFQSIGMFSSCVNQQRYSGCLSEPASWISSRLTVTAKREQQLNKCWPNIPIHGWLVYCKWTYKWTMESLGDEDQRESFHSMMDQKSLCPWTASGVAVLLLLLSPASSLFTTKRGLRGKSWSNFCSRSRCASGQTKPSSKENLA